MIMVIILVKGVPNVWGVISLTSALQVCIQEKTAEPDQLLVVAQDHVLKTFVAEATLVTPAE